MLNIYKRYHATARKCFCPPPTAVAQRSLPTCSVANYVLPPCTLIACLCTLSAVGAAVSASLCSELVILTYWATLVGEVTSPSRDTMCQFCAPVLYTNNIVIILKKYIKYKIQMYTLGQR